MKLCLSSLAASTALLLIAVPAQAQEETRPGQVAESAVGQVGQRRSATTIENGPMGRVNNRIQNRIDRSYDPTVNTTSPFEVAAEQTTRGQPGQ